MAWLEKRGQRFLLVFRLNGSRYKKLLDEKDRRAADGIAAKVDRRIEMLERGEWRLPDPANIVDSLVDDIAPRPVVQLPTGKTLGALIDEYIPSVSTGCLELNTVATLTTHLNHVRTVMGRNLRVIHSLELPLPQDLFSALMRPRRHHSRTVNSALPSMRAAAPVE